MQTLLYIVSYHVSRLVVHTFWSRERHCGLRALLPHKLLAVECHGGPGIDHTRISTHPAHLSPSRSDPFRSPHTDLSDGLSEQLTTLEPRRHPAPFLQAKAVEMRLRLARAVAPGSRRTGTRAKRGESADP